MEVVDLRINDYVKPYIRVENINIYGLENSVRVSKFPMSVNTSILTEELTARQNALGSCVPSSGHDCFLKGIVVQCDLTLPQYIWQQIKRYHFFDIVSSQSTMHKITKMNIADSCTPDVDITVIKLLEKLIADYNKETDAVWKEELFRKIIANIPSGLMLTAGITTNYLQIKTMRIQRKEHKMKEWRELCNVFETLPNFNELVLGR